MAPLKRYLQKKGISQVEFAQLVGVTEAAVSHWLSGRYRIGRKTALKVSSITGIPVLHLLYPKENQ